MSDGMGHSLTASRVTEIRKDEFTTTFLTKVEPTFYRDAAQLLNSMMDTRNSMSGGELRDGYAKRVRETMIDIKEITRMRLDKIYLLASNHVFNDHGENLTQATPEERKTYKSIKYTLYTFKSRGGDGRVIPLEPCPFCGDHAHVVTAFGTVTYVQCQNKKCNAIIQVDGADRVQECMARWNRRS